MPFITVNDHTLHYTDTPPSTPSSTAPTLIFIHGLGSTQNYFGPILPYLTPTYRCITFDVHGAGRSPFPPSTTTPTHSIATIAADALSLLTHLCGPSSTAIAIGYSMGGMIPTYLAATSSTRIRAAVLIGPVHPSPSVAAVFKARIPTVREHGMDAMANTIPTAATGSGASALARAFIREMLLAQSVEGYVANCRAIEEAKPPAYEAVKCPVLIVAGREDKSAPVEGCECILGELGSQEKRMEVLEGVGHWHCVEAPERVGELIRGFCDGIVG